MNNQQIYSILCWSKETHKSFKGVFPADYLAAAATPFLLPACFVVNTDPSTKPGAHWVAYYFDKKGGVDYFDSYGLPPTTPDLLTFFSSHNSGGAWRRFYNGVKLQGNTSKACGFYCVYFLIQ